MSSKPVSPLPVREMVLEGRNEIPLRKPAMSLHLPFSVSERRAGKDSRLHMCGAKLVLLSVRPLDGGIASSRVKSSSDGASRSIAAKNCCIVPRSGFLRYVPFTSRLTSFAWKTRSVQTNGRRRRWSRRRRGAKSSMVINGSLMRCGSTSS